MKVTQERPEDPQDLEDPHMLDPQNLSRDGIQHITGPGFDVGITDLAISRYLIPMPFFRTYAQTILLFLIIVS